MSKNYNQQNQDQNNRAKSEGFLSFKKIDDFLLSLSRVPLKEKLFFTQYLGLMLKSGISLSASIESLSVQSSNKYFSKILKEISANVERGVSLTESLKPYERVFGELYVNMIEAGEVSGKLEEVLSNLYLQMKKQHELNAKVKGALIYPATIITAMIIIGIFMMVMVVPELLGILKSYDVEMPLPTKIFIAFSEFILGNGVLVFFVVFLAVLLLIQVLRTRQGKFYFQWFLLRMPIISPIIKKINLARFSRIVSTLMKTDIMIVKTFSIAANTLGNLHYREVALEMSERLKKGSQLNEVILARPDLFPPSIAQMVMVGEKTGELDNVLSELAEFYEMEVHQTMDSLPSIIEPLLILILGVLVGGIAIAIMLPYYSLISSI